MRPRRRNGTRYLGMSPRGGIAEPPWPHYSETGPGCQCAHRLCGGHRLCGPAAWNFDPRHIYSIHGAESHDLSEGLADATPHSLDQWTHDHVFLGSEHAHNERRTWFVVALTAAMMVGEIAAGSIFGSMALLADGWHMATHAAALGIAAIAYLFCAPASAQFPFCLRHRQVRRPSRFFQRDHPRDDRGSDRL